MKKSRFTDSQIIAVLMAIPDVELNKGILPGKIFEYLATRKPVLCVGPAGSDADHILREAGVVGGQHDQLLAIALGLGQGGNGPGLAAGLVRRRGLPAAR